MKYVNTIEIDCTGLGNLAAILAKFDEAARDGCAVHLLPWHVHVPPFEVATARGVFEAGARFRILAKSAEGKKTWERLRREGGLFKGRPVLTNDQRAEIRDKHAGGASISQLARDYNVAYRTLQRIVKP